jgi:hypothetical protein
MYLILYQPASEYGSPMVIAYLALSSRIHCVRNDTPFGGSLTETFRVAVSRVVVALCDPHASGLRRPCAYVLTWYSIRYVKAGPDMTIWAILSPSPYLRIVSSPVSSCGRLRFAPYSYLHNSYDQGVVSSLYLWWSDISRHDMGWAVS